MTTKQLEQGGVEIQTMHFRIRENRKPLPKGGETRVLLRFPDRKTYEGIAYCHPNDTYSRSEGFKVALGRAVKGAHRGGSAGALKLRKGVIANESENSANIDC